MFHRAKRLVLGLHVKIPDAAWMVRDAHVLPEAGHALPSRMLYLEPERIREQLSRMIEDGPPDGMGNILQLLAGRPASDLQWLGERLVVLLKDDVANDSASTH